MRYGLSKIDLNIIIYDALNSGDWSEVENADVSYIDNMSYMFYKVQGIKDLDLSKWDTSNATNMKHMFNGSDFDSPLNFNTLNVTNMSYMFFESKYNSLLDFDTSNVKNMNSIFKSALFNQDISDWIIQDCDNNQDVIEYKEEYIQHQDKLAKDAIKLSIEKNKKTFSRIIKL